MWVKVAMFYMTILHSTARNRPAPPARNGETALDFCPGPFGNDGQTMQGNAQTKRQSP